MKYYEPCSRFMSGGSLYGRSRHPPHRAGRICRIFRTCIHLNFKTDNFWFHRTANADAYNNQSLHPLFAYELRHRDPVPTRPPPCKAMPIEVEPNDVELQWREAA